MARHISFFLDGDIHIEDISPQEKRVCDFLCARTPLLILIERLVPNEKVTAPPVWKAGSSLFLHSLYTIMFVCLSDVKVGKLGFSWFRAREQLVLYQRAYNFHTFVNFLETCVRLFSLGKC